MVVNTVVPFKIKETEVIPILSVPVAVSLTVWGIVKVVLASGELIVIVGGWVSSGWLITSGFLN